MQIDLSFGTLVYLLSFFQALLLGLFFISFNRGNRKANIFLGVFILSYYFEDLYNFFGSSGIISEYHFLIFFPSLALFFYGPAIFFYVNSIVNEGFSPAPKKIVLSFTLGIVELLFGLFLFFQPVETKIDLAQSETFYLVHHIYSLIAGLHALIYVGLSINSLNSYKKYQVGETSSLAPKQIKWLKIFLMYWFVRFILWVVLKIIILTVGGFSDYDLATFLFYVPDILSVCSFIVIYSMSFISLKNIDVVSGFFQKKKYANNQLDVKDEVGYYNRILTLLKGEKKYLNVDYKIVDMAKELNTNTNYLSQVINKHYGDNFTQLINQFRIEEVKKRLHDPSFDFLKISAIAEECGFKSKSTFIRVFRLHTGMLPKEYKEST